MHVFLALAALIAATLALGAGANAQPAASLRPVSLAPLTVRGTGFVPSERVRVTLAVGRRSTHVRSVKAGSDGRFTVAFDLLLAVDPCRGTLVVTATGSRGSRAAYTKVCRPPSLRPRVVP
ncbi:MAG: hypothetical protein ACRDN6_05500 [Gaiellaceae bacterium]